MRVYIDEKAIIVLLLLNKL